MKKTKNQHVHFTTFGVSAQPSEADADGYLAYREDFERLPEDEWTRAERWIHDAETSVAARR